MSDVVMHVSSPEKVLEDAKRELHAAQAALSAIGKKGLLERQTAHDKKLADAQAAIDAAQAKVLSAQAAVDAAKFEANRPKLASEVGEPSKPQQEQPHASSSTLVEDAAERVRQLKAQGAPQVEVRSAVEYHALQHLNALKASNAPEADVKSAEVNYKLLVEDPMVFTPLEAFKRNVRTLKAQGASAEQVQAAEAAYTALCQRAAAAGTPQGSSDATQQPASSTHTAQPTTQADHADNQASRGSSTLQNHSSPPATVQEAAERVRDLKAAKAPQAEVKAAVDAYIALTASKQDALKAPAVPIQPGPLESAAEKVRALKAAKAPQAEVKAAVDAYVALTGSISTPQEAKGSATGQSSLEQAAERVRALKAARAPQSEVKAAVDAYVALEGNDRTASTSSAQTSGETSKSIASSKSAESKNVETSALNPELERAAERVRALKAAAAPQAEVKAAVEAYAVEEARTTVRKLKDSGASQQDVKIAVEKLVALLDGASSSPATSATQSQSESQTQTQTQETTASNVAQGDADVRVHLSEP